MNLVIVNCTYETFTPAHSGAICTWVREVCRAAEADGVQPLLISRRSTHPQYDRPGTIWLDYPTVPQGPVLTQLVRLQKRAMGWVRPRQGAYCAIVADAIRKAGAENWPLLLHNDMELCVSLRQQFPNARILHLAHNHNGSTPRYQRQFAASVDVPLAVSDFTSRWNETFYEMTPGSIKTLHNGVDLEAFRPTQEPGIPLPVINYTGRLDRHKGADVLLKAALHVAARTRAFSIQIVGRKLYDKDMADDYTRELDRLGVELGKAGVDYRFTGWIDRDRLPSVLGAAHIHVTPSRWDEPFGLTTLEAMACGMAVVGSRTGGTPEVIGDAGFLFDREDDASLADLLEPLVRDPSLRANYGRRARARAESFSWAATWQNLKQVVQLSASTRKGGEASRASIGTSHVNSALKSMS